MVQPFLKFEARFRDQVIKLKRNFLVSQTYSRGYDHLEEIHKTSILLTDYDDHGLAKVHLNALQNDKFASIINLEKPAHLAKLNEMMAGNDYELYWGVVKSNADLQKRLDASYKEKIRRYIEAKTNWKITGSEEVKINFKVIFGELFIALKWRNQNPLIEFKEIERF